MARQSQAAPQAAPRFLPAVPGNTFSQFQALATATQVPSAQIVAKDLIILMLNPLLVITASEIACVRAVVKCRALIVAGEVIFGMAVAYMVSVEQRASYMETVASTNVSHSDICLNALYFLRSSAPSYN